MNKNTNASGITKLSFNPDLFLWLGAILLLTFISFSPTLKNSFINWDDNAYVFENQHLSKPLPQAISYFFGPHYFVGNYIPLTMITYALEYHSAGLKPGLYHNTNLLFHLANALLVFWFIYLLSRRKNLVAGLVSLLFALHPMHVESVAWIAELKDVQYSFFFLAGLISYYKYMEIQKQERQPESGTKFLVYTLLFFILSILSKPAAVVFPLVLLLVDFYAKRIFNKRTWIEKIPFLLISVLFGIIALKAQAADRLLHEDYSFFQRVLFASHSLLSYLVKLFLPIHQAIFYPYPVREEGMLPFLYYLAPFIVIALFYMVYRSLKHSRLIVFGALFFLVNLILVLQLISVGDAIRADRYTYIAYIGIFFILAMKFETFYKQKKETSPSFKPISIAVVSFLIFACSYLTHARGKVWNNDMSVATDLLNKFPDDHLALNNKGYILFEQGLYDQAIPLFAKAIALKRDYLRPYMNLMNSYLSIKDIKSALSVADSGLKYIPNEVNLLNRKGNIYFMQGNYPEAMKLYTKSITLRKEDVSTYIYQAEYYYTIKDYDKGINVIEIALQFEPNNYLLLNNKGYFLCLKKQYHEAIEYYKASLKSKPDYGIASVNLADCYKEMDNSTGVKK